MTDEFSEAQIKQLRSIFQQEMPSELARWEPQFFKKVEQHVAERLKLFKTEQSELKKDHLRTKSKLLQLECEMLSRGVDIVNFPVLTGVASADTVIRIGKAIGCAVSPEDIARAEYC